jgi:hypothetical protein
MHSFNAGNISENHFIMLFQQLSFFSGCPQQIENVFFSEYLTLVRGKGELVTVLN